MSALLTFATSSPWRAVALGLALLLAIGFIRLEFAKASAERARASLALCEVNVGTLESALIDQNKKVEGFQAEALARQAEDLKRAEEARKRRERDRRREAADDRSGAERMNEFMQSTFGG